MMRSRTLWAHRKRSTTGWPLSWQSRQGSHFSYPRMEIVVEFILPNSFVYLPSLLPRESNNITHNAL